MKLTAEDIQDAKDGLARGKNPEIVAQLLGLEDEKELREVLEKWEDPKVGEHAGKLKGKDNELKEHIRQGLTDSEIARIYGVVPGAVAQWRNLRGIAGNKKKVAEKPVTAEKTENLMGIPVVQGPYVPTTAEPKTFTLRINSEATAEKPELPVPVIKDSGDRTRFETGAVRDMHEGKGRYDLLPWVALGRLAGHFEKGAIKYGESNWRNGIPIHSYMDSAVRHLAKYMMGMTDEDHLVAAAWNVMCALETEMTMPGMQDLPARKGKSDG